MYDHAIYVSCGMLHCCIVEGYGCIIGSYNSVGTLGGESPFQGGSIGVCEGGRGVAKG